MRAADQPPSQPSPDPQYYQVGSGWGGPPPSAPRQFASPAPWNHTRHPPPRNRNPWAIVAGAAAVVIVLVLAAIGISLGMRDDNNTPNAGRTTTTIGTTTSTTTTYTSPSGPAPDAQNRLLSLLPSGYPPGSCKPASQPMSGALVSVLCGQNTDPNGPTASTYGLFSDLKGLQDAFTRFTGTDTIVPCPGGKASPGTWWHTKDPKTVLGQLACGTYKGDEPQVMWTNQQTMVFALVGGKPQGPNLDQLYNWWASHS